MQHDFIRIFAAISGRKEKDIGIGDRILLSYASPQEAAGGMIKKLPQDAELHLMADSIEIWFDRSCMRLLSDGTSRYVGNVPEDLKREWSDFVECYRLCRV